MEKINIDYKGRNHIGRDDIEGKNLTVFFIRKYHNLSQHELSKNIGISQGHLSNIEAGRRGISLKLLEKYANYFKITLLDIIRISLFLDEKEELKPYKFLKQQNDISYKILHWAKENGY